MSDRWLQLCWCWWWMLYGFLGSCVVALPSGNFC
jgi:hypothetical protein